MMMRMMVSSGVSLHPAVAPNTSYSHAVSIALNDRASVSAIVPSADPSTAFERHTKALTWSSTTDVDPHVVMPTSIAIDFGNHARDSGEFDPDKQAGRPGAVENVVFTAPPAGSYTYSVRNYNGAAAGSLMMQVFKDGNRPTGAVLPGG
jgi:uncharacterized protein YfaP (DUF2135 family)